MSKTFSLNIMLGNDTMQTGSDVAEALRQVAERIVGHGVLGFDGPSKVMDGDGNVVGTFGVQGADSMGGENRS